MKWQNNKESIYLLSFENADTQDEGEEEFVLLKQWATHVSVDTVGEVIIQVEDSLLQVIRRSTVCNGLKGRNIHFTIISTIKRRVCFLCIECNASVPLSGTIFPKQRHNDKKYLSLNSSLFECIFSQRRWYVRATPLHVCMIEVKD